MNIDSLSPELRNIIEKNTRPGYKVRRLFTWAIVHAILTYVAYAAMHLGHAGASNILIFFVWVNFIMMAIIMSSEPAKFTMRTIKRVIPGWLSHSVGLAFIIAFVYHGWWVMALLFSIAELLEAALYSEEAK